MCQINHKWLHLNLAIVAGLLLGASELAAGESRWYLESKLGQADFSGTLGSRWPKQFDSKESSVTVELGYSVNRYLAVQVGYHDLGSHKGFGVPCPEDSVFLCFATLESPTEGFAPCGELGCITALTAEVSGLSLSAVPRWPFNDRFAIYGKVGVIDWNADVPLISSEIESFSDRDLLAAVGLQLTFSKGLGLLAEYQELGFDVGSASLGASWRF